MTMTMSSMRLLSTLALAGALSIVGIAGSSTAAEADTGVCGTYGAYSAKNSQCNYKIQSYSRYNNKYTYGNKAAMGRTSSQGVCTQYTTYGVKHQV